MYFKEGEAPAKDKVADLLNFHSFEVESTEEVNDDTVFDVKVLPNRAHDCLSHEGIAQELAAITNVKLKDFSASETVTAHFAPDISVSVEDTKACSRYTARVMRGIAVGESPEWMKKSLTTIGQKSINNIVDAANMRMFATGQPLHVFDADKVEGNIAVRFAREGETITTLDNKEIKLDPSVLIIADESSPLAIAGIKGGQKAEATTDTKNIILESATFNGTLIRKTSQKLGIRTDASARFEHEIAPALAPRALSKLTNLILKVAGTDTTTVSEIIDIHGKLPRGYWIGITPAEVNRHLGTSYSEKEVCEIFDRLGFQYEIKKPRDTIAEIAPNLIGKPYRYGASTMLDAPDEMDCSSLVQYIYRQVGIFAPRVSVDLAVFARPIQENELEIGDLIFYRTKNEDGVRYASVEFLPGTRVERGVSHVAVYVGGGKNLHASGREGVKKSLIEPLNTTQADGYELVSFGRVIENNDPRIVVTIPHERLDLFPTRGFLTGGTPMDLIEEVGRMHGYERLAGALPSKSTAAVHKSYYYAELIRAKLAAADFSETINYSFADNGDLEIENPLAGQKSHLRTNLADQISDRLAFNKINQDLLGLSAVKIFEIGNVYGKAGERTHVAIASSTKDELPDLGFKAVNLYNGAENIYEFDLTEALAGLPLPASYRELPDFEESREMYKRFSPYPFVVRDIAVWVPEGVMSDEIADMIHEHTGDLEVINAFRLIDQYKKDGKISYAFRLVFQSKDRTLAGEEVAAIMDSIARDLNMREGWKVR